MKIITTALLSILFVFASVSQSHALNVLASSTISGTEIGTSGTYNYTLTLTALTYSAPIESFWFAWVPGKFFLQSQPTSITGDNGWTGSGNSGSIQFTGGTPITPGNTVTFTFQSTITPDQMTADVGTASSVVYPGAINFIGTRPNETIGVQTLPQSAPTDVLASSTILGTEIGATGTFNYTLTLTALSNSAPIEAFWFAWTPGNFFLQSQPTSITGDNGWTGAGNSGSIQFTGGTPITAGNTVTFTFQSTITPDQMTADVGTASSVVYPGAITFSGTSPNETIGVQTLAPPAPTNVLASSTISGTEIGATGTYDYTLTLTALTNSAPIESFWFAWTPGNFFLQSTPSDITGDNGWVGAGDSGSIQFTGGTPIAAGNTVTFTFQSTITPDQMAADVGTNSSVVYPGAINFSGTAPNETIGVQTLTPPAPTNVLASSTITGTEIGTSGTYNYTLTLTALSNSAPIESYWFAWTPGNFFLNQHPPALLATTGWTARWR